MSEEELEAKFVAALREWVNLTKEYETLFVSSKPLGMEDIPLMGNADIEELTNKIKLAEKAYAELRALKYKR